MCSSLALQSPAAAKVSVMEHTVGTIRSSASDVIVHSGGAGWRDSARLEARVGATRDGAGVADEHSRGAGWRDSARPEARVSATRDGADGEGQCGIASRTGEMAVPVECDRAIVVRDREIRCESRHIPVVSSGKTPSAEPGCVAESPKSDGTYREEAHLRREDCSFAETSGLNPQSPTFSAWLLPVSLQSLTVGMYPDPWYFSHLCRLRAYWYEKF